jgi:cysteine desulfurase
MSFPIYLDYNATTPVLKETADALVNLLVDDFGNAASTTHRFGWKAAEKVKTARANLAKTLNCEPNELYFNSGATEGLNTTIKGLFSAYASKGKHFISSKTEHKAVMDSLAFIESQGAEISWLEVDKSGLVPLLELQSKLRPDTVAVCLMLANNETGVIQDLSTLAKAIHDVGAILVCDATQAVGKIPVDVQALGVDVLVFSGHKCYAMKGIGGMFVRRKNPRVKIFPLLHGGGHENGLRSGTLNVPGIVSMELSLQIILGSLLTESNRQIGLKHLLETGLKELGGIIVGEPSLRLPNTTMVLMPGIKAEKLITQLPQFAFSTGSACTSALPKPSHVLLAMGYSENEAFSAIRISTGRFTDEKHILAFLADLKQCLEI